MLIYVFNKMHDVFLKSISKKATMQFQIVLGMTSKIKKTRHKSELQKGLNNSGF